MTVKKIVPRWRESAYSPGRSRQILTVLSGESSAVGSGHAVLGFTVARFKSADPVSRLASSRQLEAIRNLFQVESKYRARKS